MQRSPFFTFTQYINYKLRAVGPHSIHSPFVFELYNEVIKKASATKLSQIEAIRKQMKGNHQVIDLVNLKQNKPYRTTISSIARTSLSTLKFSAFLCRLAKFLEVQTILETGTSLGINTLYLAQSGANVVTIEGSEVIAQHAMKNFNTVENNSIQLIRNDVHSVFPSLLIKHQPELIFLDADHRGKYVSKQVKEILSHVPGVKCIVLHDIYWSEDMKSMWTKTIDDPGIPLTIDLFQAGLLFPGLTTEKQHFTIRF